MQQIFFEILCSALWGTPVNTPKDVDWKKLIEVFEDHALLGVASDAILSLPLEQLPPMELQMEMFQHVAELTQGHSCVADVRDKVFEVLEGQGMKPVLMKGPVLAALYPKRLVRSCGDVDVYIGKEDYDRACDVMCELCGYNSKEDGEFEDDVHFHCTYDGVEVEIHKYACECCDISRFEAFNRFADEQNAQGDRFNAVFIFDHLAKHMRNEGIGIRQFVDWALLLHYLSEKVGGFDSEEGRKFVAQLDADLQTYSRKDIWQGLSGILVYQLGLPKKECPFFDAKMARRSQGRVLQYIYDSGNFGKHKEWSPNVRGMKRDWRRLKIALGFVLERAWVLWALSPGWSVMYLRKELGPIVLRRLGLKK